jgi:hypothetical protein
VEPFKFGLFDCLRLGLRCCAPFIIKTWWWTECMHMNRVGRKLFFFFLKWMSNWYQSWPPKKSFFFPPIHFKTNFFWIVWNCDRKWNISFYLNYVWKMLKTLGNKTSHWLSQLCFKQGHALLNDITIIVQVYQILKPLFLGRSTRKGANQIGLP